MKIFKCSVCKFEIDIDKFEKLPGKWKCQCGADKKKFRKVTDPLEESIKILHKYREGTPPGDVEVE